MTPFGHEQTFIAVSQSTLSPIAMARIEIPPHLLPSLGPEMKMDTHWVDVKLRDGRRLKNLVVQGGRFLTGRANDQNGEGTLDFVAADIVKVRRRSLLPFFW
jgi:hypothetical protein